jgi:hypothetical protein
MYVGFFIGRATREQNAKDEVFRRFGPVVRNLVGSSAFSAAHLLDTRRRRGFLIGKIRSGIRGTPGRTSGACSAPSPPSEEEGKEKEVGIPTLGHGGLCDDEVLIVDILLT